MPDPTGSASTSTVVVDDEKTFDAAYVKKLNDENAKRRVENRDLKTELAAVKEQVTALGDIDARLKALAGVKPGDNKTDPVEALAARMDTIEKLNEASADAAKKAEAGRQQTLIDAEIATQAMGRGLEEWVEPSHVLSLVDRANIKYDAETKTVEGVDAALDALKESAAGLFNAENARALHGTPGPGTPRARGDSGKSLNESVIDVLNNSTPTPFRIKLEEVSDVWAPANPAKPRK